MTLNMGESSLLDRLMGVFDEDFGDSFQDVHHRADLLRIYFKHMEKVTGGRISLERLVRSRCVLDVGMGRGALAILLRFHGMEDRIVGVNVKHYDGVTGYEL